MEFEFSYKKIKMSDIEALEEKLFVKFPKDYVDFLLANNGGRSAKERYFKKW